MHKSPAGNQPSPANPVRDVVRPILNMFYTTRSHHRSRTPQVLVLYSGPVRTHPLAGITYPIERTVRVLFETGIPDHDCGSLHEYDQ